MKLFESYFPLAVALFIQGLGLADVAEGKIVGANILFLVSSVLYALIFAPGWQEDF